ncbi:MAP kinase phosphatase 2 [Mycena chlorophos]|uniref:MAP kinase phosphatase 2 n=1 Tax=Mycena chlorophos TaxID=658473 RepID=A0A8H6VSD0_MYCCL|nr:MAP kinase phosphatase 2 [Mycena chlorophos]
MREMPLFSMQHVGHITTLRCRRLLSPLCPSIALVYVSFVVQYGCPRTALQTDHTAAFWLSRHWYKRDELTETPFSSEVPAAPTTTTSDSKMVWRNVDPIIENKLYLGNLVAARSTRSLTGMWVSLICAPGPNLFAARTPHHMFSPFAPEAIPAELPQSGIQHMRIPVGDVDYADLLIHLPSACQFIHQALLAERVLVHDVQGILEALRWLLPILWTQRLNADKGARNHTPSTRPEFISTPGSKGSWYAP